MTENFDVAIAGLGAMGGAAAYHLARRGTRVIGFDRFAPPHDRGSSHGESRIIRVAYFEDPRYVPLVRRAWDLWLELETEAGIELLEPTGGLMIGPREGTLVNGALASASAHKLPHDLLDAEALAARFPAHRPNDDVVAVWEPQAGVLDPEACVSAHLEGAIAAGATLRFDEPVVAWEVVGKDVRVHTNRETLRVRRLILAAGAWLPRLLPRPIFPVEITRQPLVWFMPTIPIEAFDAERFPIFIREHELGRFIYGFPKRAGRLKFAIHMEGERVDPDGVRRAVGDDEVEKLRAILRSCVPGAAGECVDRAVCLYTTTRDGHFRLGVHPEHPQVLVASCCSGHGFKFASAVGEVLADLAVDKSPAYDLQPFALEA